MSRKTLNIILIIVTFSVYGSIVYKYFGGTLSSEIIPSLDTRFLLPKVNQVTLKDTFVLKITDRDPFLDKTYRIRHKKVDNNNALLIPSSSKIEQKNKPWPIIEYLGFTKSNTRKNKTAILRIDGKLYRKRQGVVFDDFKIVFVNNDSIEVQFYDEKRYITRY